jgi:hypothetical protein
MKISRHDKVLLFEQEFVMLVLVAILGLAFHFWQQTSTFYFFALLAGFLLYFWMIWEEHVHTTGMKHSYFEHTSSFIMIAQTALALQLASRIFQWEFFTIIFMVIGVIMYSLSLSRIVLFKVVFKDEHKA